jgi:uncharacterized membrane protein
MRKIIFTFFISLFFIPFFSLAQNGGEVIRDFHSDIHINSDATFNVTENIKYDFGSQQKHGIYRYIPYKYKQNDGKTRLTPITNISVKNESQVSYKFEKSTNNDFLELKIGDANKYVTGLKTYIISYKVDGAINYFDSQDELYWNVTGNGWKVPIDRVSVNLKLPKKAETKDLTTDCFQGVLSSKEKCEISQEQEPIDTINYVTTRSLSTGEGLTFAVGFPKGMVVKKDYIYVISFFSTLLGQIWLAGNILAPIVAFIVMFVVWRKKGRDPRGRGTIIAQFDAPDGVDAIAVGTIVDEKVDKKDISAGIVDMAVKGYLKINRLDGKGIFKTKDYELTKIKGSNGLEDYDQKIFNALFADGSTIKLKDLSTSFVADIKEAQKMVFASLVTRGYFAKNPQKVRNTYLVVGSLLIFAGIIGISFVPFVVVVGVTIMIFGFFMPARTLKGVYAKEHILGLKEYLSVAEKDRIKFHNAPEKNPQTFEKYLPYAMALGVEKEWAKQFEGIFKENPSWYGDPSMRTFSATAFASNIGDFSTSAGAVSVPAGSGGSGTGGGGFSGGGFGGGGGGSW